MEAAFGLHKSSMVTLERVLKDRENVSKWQAKAVAEEKAHMTSRAVWAKSVASLAAKLQHAKWNFESSQDFLLKVGQKLEHAKKMWSEADKGAKRANSNAKDAAANLARENRRLAIAKKTASMTMGKLASAKQKNLSANNAHASAVKAHNTSRKQAIDAAVKLGNAKAELNKLYAAKRTSL